MIKRIGVLSCLEVDDKESFMKRDALYFDHLIFTPVVEENEVFNENAASTIGFGETYQYLRSENLFVDFGKRINSIQKIQETLDSITKASTVKRWGLFDFQKFEVLLKRACAMALTDETTSAVPVQYSDNIYEYTFEGSHHNECLEVIIKNFPTPEESVSWREVIEFRKDLDVQKKRRALLNWQNELVRSNLKPFEIADKIAHLIDDYESYLKLHRLKSRNSTIGIILTIGAEMLEGFLRLKPTKAVEAMLSFNRKNLYLMEAEMNAPGREIAYISVIRNRFGKRN